MSRPLFNYELFKTGNYGDRGNWTEAEIKEVKRDFFERKANDLEFSGVDIIVSTNPANPHDKNNAIKLGKITDLYLKSGGIFAGNGYHYDEPEKTDIMRNISGKSAGFVKKERGWSLDHVVVTPTDLAVIKDLKPNKESMFSFQDSKEVVYLDYKLTEKEKNMPNEITFSESDLKLRVQEAVEKKKEELQANFATRLAEKDSEIAQKDQLIADYKAAADEMKATIAEFARTQKDTEVAEIEKRVDAIKGITADQKEKLKTKVVGFARAAFEGYKDAVNDMIEYSEGLPPLVEEGEHPGDRKAAEFAEYEPKRFGIDEIIEAIEKNKGGE